jgi:hypothetical protein
MKGGRDSTTKMVSGPLEQPTVSDAFDALML